jgi:hypothetical protein
MASLANSLNPTRPGSLEPAVRVVHASDRIRSSSGEGEASRRDIARPAGVTTNRSIAYDTQIDGLVRSTSQSIPTLLRRQSITLAGERDRSLRVQESRG